MPDQEQHTITVFVENEAGSNIKHHYNEATFTVERTEQVGAHYPYPYGFIPDTIAPDGDAAAADGPDDSSGQVLFDSGPVSF